MELEKMQNFSDLTDFIYDEYLKITENFGIQKASESMIDFTEKALKKYVKLYNKPMFRRAKRELKLQEAIDTMPHGKIWIFFNRKMWAKIQERLGQTKDFNANLKESEKPIALPAEIVKQYDVPQLSEGEISASVPRIDYEQ